MGYEKNDSWLKKMRGTLVDILCPFWSLIEGVNIRTSPKARGKDAAVIPIWAGMASLFGLLLFSLALLLGKLALLGSLVPFTALGGPLLLGCAYGCMYLGKFLGSLAGHAHFQHLQSRNSPENKQIITPGQAVVNSLGLTFLGTSFRHVRQLFNQKSTKEQPFKTNNKNVARTSSTEHSHEHPVLDAQQTSIPKVAEPQPLLASDKIAASNFWQRTIPAQVKHSPDPKETNKKVSAEDSYPAMM